MVICWTGGIGPHHKNEFDVVLSVTGHDRTKIITCIMTMLLGWNLVRCDAYILV